MKTYEVDLVDQAVYECDEYYKYECDSDILKCDSEPLSDWVGYYSNEAFEVWYDRVKDSMCLTIHSSRTRISLNIEEWYVFREAVIAASITKAIYYNRAGITLYENNHYKINTIRDERSQAILILLNLISHRLTLCFNRIEWKKIKDMISNVKNPRLRRY